MATASKSGRRARLFLLVCVLGLIVLSIGLAAFHKTPWVVPPNEKARKNPLRPSEADLAKAREIYGNKCSDCHGDKGKGDGSEAMMYDPAPSDLTDAAKIDKLTDGEIYYQITEGRKPMPSFRKKLTDEQRWQLVLLVRAFAAHASGESNAVPDKPAIQNSAKSK
jgi:mono/diheme cytochrome c family protein